MPAFEFRSLDHRGKIRKGTLEADSARQVRQQLRDKGWVPIEVNEAQDRPQSRVWPFFFPLANSVEQQALVTRQLATLLKSGLPVEQALSAVSKQAANDRIERIMLAVRAKVREGFSLARSFESFPRAFPEMYRATVAAGSRAGTWSRCWSNLPTTWKPATTRGGR